MLLPFGICRDVIANETASQDDSPESLRSDAAIAVPMSCIPSMIYNALFRRLRTG